jgi:hypothetical protein
MWIDVRNQLARSSTVPQVNRVEHNFAVIHYNGPAVLNADGSYVGDLALLKADARYHVYTQGWDGLSYTYAIGREQNSDGTAKAYQCRDWNAKLAHSGNTLMNNEAFAIFVATGDSDPVPSYMLSKLQERLNAIGIERRYVLGHQESPRTTACPGAIIMRHIYAKRAEVQQHNTGVKVKYVANIRDESNTLSAIVGKANPGATFTGEWILGKPVKGDSLWLRISGDRYIHASALDTRSYQKVWN